MKNMRNLVFWIAALVACVTSEADMEGAEERQPILVISDNSDGSNWPETMYFPDDQEQPRPGRIYGQAYYFAATRDDVDFVLFTRQGPTTGEPLKLGDAEQLGNSTFNRGQRTVFITHGFISSISSNTVQDIKEMYLGYHEVNVIAVDWSRIASIPLYFVVKKQTIPVGGVVAEFVHFLNVSGGMDLSNIHLIGHSLGAHVMGIAAKGFKNTTKIGRVTGLDPAGPLFKLEDPSTRLDRDDAEFVDVIHTCGGWLGFLPPIGTVDFFPNGGRIGQPGCPMDQARVGACSHSRAWEFFAESINSPSFSSLPCPSYDDFKQKNCEGQPKAPMGEPAPHRISGKYFLDTAASPPYALG